MRGREYSREILRVVLFVSVSVVFACGSCGFASAAAEDDSQNWYTRFGGNLLSGSNAPFLDLSGTPGPIAGLSISGFLNNTTGMWANSSALRNFGRSSGEHHGSNSLAVERSWVQIDTNYILDG